MDWLDSFIKRFSMFKEIQSLASDKFHGSIEIHFSDGVPQSYNLKINRRAVSTLTKGD